MTPKVSDIHTLVGVGLSGLISTLLGQAAWTVLGHLGGQIGVGQGTPRGGS